MKSIFFFLKTIYLSQKGQSLVELLVTIGLAGILLPALITGLYATRGGISQQDQRQQAIAYVREGIEATRAFEEGDWATFSSYSAPTPTPRYPYVDTTTNAWKLPIGSESLSGGFTRTISITPVYRDFTTTPPNIVTSGGTLDPSTVEVIVTVSWSNPVPSSVTATEYLTRNSNLTQTDTSMNDFSRSGYTLNSVMLYSPSSSSTSTDGEIMLSAAASADWCSPGQPVADTNLGGNGLAGSVVAGVNRAYVGTGQNASSHPFYNVTIDYTGTLPSPSVASNGYYDENGLKVNDVYGETIGTTSYAYLGTSVNGGRQIEILNVTSNPPSLVSSIPKQANKVDTNSVFVSNNILYFTAGNILYTFKLDASRSNPTFQGSFTLAATGNKIYVVGNYVYVALGSTASQLQVVDASNPAAMKNPGGGSAVLLHTNSQPAVGLYVLSDNSRVYLVSSQANPDFFIIKPNSTTNPTSWSVVGSGYSTGTMNPKGITVIDNRAIIVGFTNPRYQVLKVKDSSGNDTYTWCNPTNANEPDDIYNVSSQYVNGNAYSYIVTSNTNSAFEMIQGGTGGSGLYTTSGTYTSGPWSPTPIKSTVFNRIDVTVNKPSGTDIKLQVGIADVGLSTTCSDANFTYVGPAGPGSYFNSGTSNVTTSITIPFPPSSGWSTFINPGKCFAYKAYLYASSDQTQTPYLEDVTWSYSP